MAMKSRGKPKRARSIRFDEKDLELAKKDNNDISKIARESLKRALFIAETIKANKK